MAMAMPERLMMFDDRPANDMPRNDISTASGNGSVTISTERRCRRKIRCASVTSAISSSSAIRSVSSERSISSERS